MAFSYWSDMATQIFFFNAKQIALEFWNHFFDEGTDIVCFQSLLKLWILIAGKMKYFTDNENGMMPIICYFPWIKRLTRKLNISKWTVKERCSKLLFLSKKIIRIKILYIFQHLCGVFARSSFVKIIFKTSLLWQLNL